MSESAILQETPMLKQYKAIKADYRDAILFFRLGDFYEMFLDDATVASKELELTLTGRGKDDQRIPMCGIPHHAADGYITKLITKGFKVAICEQVEDPTLTKGITKREVVRVVTPGTIISSGAINEQENNYLLALCITEKPALFGISYVDCSTGEFQVALLDDLTSLTAELERLNPKEILLPESVTFSLPQQIPQTTYKPTDMSKAESHLLAHFGIASLSVFGLEDVKSVLPACWAIIEYLKATQRHSLPQLTKIRVKQSAQFMFMDRTTIQNLDLIESWPVIDKSGSLFGVLDHTKTAMGARKLKQLIKHPYLDETFLNHRLDACEALIRDPLSKEEIRTCLKSVYDLERLVSRLVCDVQNPRDLLAIKQSLESMAELAPTMAQLPGQIWEDYHCFFQRFNAPESPYQSIIKLIEKSIRPDTPPTLKDGGVIKEGYSEELDTLTDSFRTIKEWIAGLEETERIATGIKTLKVGFNKVFGYYLEITNGQKDKTPPHYIRKQTLTSAERYITPELKEKEAILLHGEDKQQEVEVSLFSDIIQTLKYYIVHLQELADIVADTDILQSLATASRKRDYVRPVFAPKTDLTLEFTDNRHPILEQKTTLHFIPNDIHMTASINRFSLITGPNMAGKSTLMRQVALTVVMAQIGCFVPAKHAKLSIVDKLFTRIGALDNLYFGQSTFMVEMLETASILNHATSASLIILDEIGRGTSTYDGMSIAYAVSEHIHQNIGARTLFATHYHELTSLERKLDGIANYNMKIIESADSIVFQYKFIPGTADKSYGIHVAKMAGLPAAVIDKASTILAGLEEEGLSYLAPNPSGQLNLF